VELLGSPYSRYVSERLSLLRSACSEESPPLNLHSHHFRDFLALKVLGLGLPLMGDSVVEASRPRERLIRYLDKPFRVESTMQTKDILKSRATKSQWKVELYSREELQLRIP